MADKELRKLSRSELVDIIYQLKKNEQKLLEENAELKRRLEDREIKVAKVGSLAEAALALSDIFQAAEESVALYVEEINRRHAALTEEKDDSAEPQAD
ncbi:MAG: DNA repair protein [Ruminococcaceae bacterium]|nr:DNA repair protein [Oscillospiraceae bacterium]